MKPEEIIIGKTYRIRSWEDITQNGFEVDRGLGGIRRWRATGPSSVLFTENMRPLCGMDFTVKSNGRGFLDQLTPEEHDDLLDKYIIAPWMLEEIEEEIEEPDRDLFGFLFQIGNKQGGDSVS